MSTRRQKIPLQPVAPWGHQGDSILGSHFGVMDYLLVPPVESSPHELVRTYDKNEEVWQHIIKGSLAIGMPIVLRAFHVFDWFPRAPGLYHTQKARFARSEALRHLHHGFKDLPKRDHAGKESKKGLLPDYTVVFTPKGKSSMLEGGVGAIRLKPLSMFGEPHWLMTASSDGTTHTGLPLAIPRKFFSRLLASIHEYGAACATVRGELEFLPDPFSRLFDRTIMVPKVLIRVIDIEEDKPASLPLENSVAVSFVSDFEGPVQVYASYVTFQP